MKWIFFCYLLYQSQCKCDVKNQHRFQCLRLVTLALWFSTALCWDIHFPTSLGAINRRRKSKQISTAERQSAMSKQMAQYSHPYSRLFETIVLRCTSLTARWGFFFFCFFFCYRCKQLWKPIWKRRKVSRAKDVRNRIRRQQIKLNGTTMKTKVFFVWR